MTEGAVTRRLNRWLLVLIVLVAVPFWWLLIDDDPGSAPPKPIHIAELRQLAGAIPGPPPTALNYTILATRLALGDIYAAGIGLKRRPLAIVAWSLPVPGAGPIVIDADATSAEAQARSFKNFDRVKQAAVAAEAMHAGVTLTTRQPPIGSALPAAADRPLAKAGVAGAAGSSAIPANAAPLVGPHAVAPGVVVIPAPDYAPGAQMIFVQLDDGEEFLFAGDISALDDNWSQLRARARLANYELAPQNRIAVLPVAAHHPPIAQRGAQADRRARQ